MNKKRFFAVMLAVVMALSTVIAPTMCFAADDDDIGTELNEVAQPVVDLLNTILNVLLGLVGAVGAIYCVFLGIKFAKAEEPQDREKAKAHLKNAIIGFVLIFVLILALRLLMPVMTKWVANNSK